MGLGTVLYAGTIQVAHWLKHESPLLRVEIGTKVTDIVTWGEVGTMELYAVAVINAKLRPYETVPYSPASTAPEEITFAATLLAAYNVYSKTYPGHNPGPLPDVVEEWRTQGKDLIQARIQFLETAGASSGRPVYSNQSSQRSFLFDSKGVAGFGTGLIVDAPEDKSWTTNR